MHRPTPSASDTAAGRLRRPVFILHTGKNGLDTQQITDRERRLSLVPRTRAGEKAASRAGQL
ncbi:hypothetical protein AZ09_13520 [Acetobacter aceti 1023]|nr:hypothetical protein AZ09_13520 [Acetobacter aceti 1023]